VLGGEGDREEEKFPLRGKWNFERASRSCVVGLAAAVLTLAAAFSLASLKLA
jgi:hypothetical protein